MSEYDPFIVIGPPRSGTTLMSKILTRLGVFMGYNINSAFEDWLFVGVNEHIMDRLDIYWDRPKRPNDYHNIDMDRIARHIEQSRGFDIDIPWGFKDPRTTICADVWKEVFDRLDVDPTWIRMKRHPMDVAVSLCTRECNKPDELLHKSEPPSRSIDTGQITPYPVKSKRGMTKRGAFDIVREYEQLCPDVELEIPYEELVKDPEGVLIESPAIMEHSKIEPHIEEIEELVNPDRAYAYRDNDKLVQFWEKNKWTEYQ